MLLKKEVYLFGMVLSGLIFGISMMLSASHTYVLSHDHCDKLPEISFKSREELDRDLISIFQGAQNRITVILTTTLYDNELKILKYIDQKRIYTEFIVRSDTTIINKLKDAKFEHLTISNLQSFYLDLNAFIVDDDVYLVPGYFSANSTVYKVQTMKISGCSPLFQDFNSFIDLYRKEVKNGNTGYFDVYEQALVAHSSAVRPTIVGTSSVFAFHSSKNSRPLRVNAVYIFNEVFKRIPKKIYIYSTTYPKIPQDTHALDEENPDLYFQLKSLLLLNQTDIYVLLNNTQKARLAGVNAYDRTEVRLLRQEDLGPSFIIIDDEVYFLSQDISMLEGTGMSYHIRINDAQIKNETINFFMDVWKKSEEFPRPSA